MSVLHDLCAARHLECMRQSVGVSEGLRQGVMLLTVWLRQRQAHEGWGSFPEDLLCSVVALLVGRGQLNTSMTGYQVFRAVLQYLSQADWQTDPPSLCAEVEPSRLVAFTSRFPVVFVDGSGWLNLAYTLTAAALLKVRQEAKLTISALGKSEGQKFQVVFLTHKSFPRSFDYLCHVTIDARSLRRSGERVDNLATAAMDVGGQMSLALTSHLEQLLTSALDDRVTLVCAAPRPNPQWSVNDAPLDYDEQSYLTFGLCLNTSAAFSVLNKGPPADHPEALAFREMWGDKSEMRRFKDGTIHEAVLWSRSSLQADRRLVCGRIVRYVLQRHCGIDKSCVHFLGGRLDTLLQAGPEEKGDGSSPGTGEEHSLAVLHAFEEVGRAVRALNTLPLAIHSVQGTHPVFRHTDVFPAEPAPPPDSESGAAHSVHGVHVPQHGRCLPAFVPALTVVCTLEGSGKWPEDREAIACLKALLHVKMAAELREKHLMSVGVARSHVDVFKAGYVFRLTVSSQREISVLRTVVSESGMVKFKDTEEAAALERDTVSLPLHTHLLHGLQQEQPSLSAAVRLCKRWLAAQMMWGYVTEEAVELIVAHTYISPHPHAAPGSPVCGLLRFLHLVSTHNWSSDPLMINLNADFTEEDFTSIPKELSQSGNSRPPMCLATPQDRTGSRWTRPHPTGHFLRRLVVLARASLHSLETQLMSDFLTADFKLIFRPALQHFHLLIRLLARANVVGHQAVDARSRPPLTRAGHLDDSKVALPVVGFNVCRKFVHDLQNIFGEYAMFFHDPFGGDVIGLVWKPQVSEVTGFKASSFPYRRPSVGHGETVSLTAGREHILDDIRLLGGGIVQSIEAPGDCPVD
ncbi:nucleolar protein 6 [Aplysia californica]|uniref:Nucleolar protein 6 n=1 Tax=Aplysia californica TaxID=6500 RepID=A0ABM1ACY7_APLCA|nr:nucleolar protein 6 [Aplysia californica]